MSYAVFVVRIRQVKVSHTRYIALGPELVAVYRKSAAGEVIPALGCNYFTPGLPLIIVSVSQMAPHLTEVTYI